MNRSSTVTQYENKVTKKAKKVLYLVLKKQNFADEIINSLQIEVEKRFKKFLNDIAGDLEKIKFEDEENSLKYIILKGMINILNQMLKERMILLSDKDKQLVNEIFEGEKQPKEKPKEEPKEESKEKPKAEPKEEPKKDLKEGNSNIPNKDIDPNFPQNGNEGENVPKKE